MAIEERKKGMHFGLKTVGFLLTHERNELKMFADVFLIEITTLVIETFSDVPLSL